MVSKENVLETLRVLSEAIGVSGNEDEVRNVVIDLLRDFADQIWIDTLGSVIAVKKGSKGTGKIMIAAHMDEIGLMISHIDKKGFIRVQPIGGWSPIILPGQRVIIVAENGRKIRGVVGSKPPHLMKPEEAKQVPELKDVFIDAGVQSREEAEKIGIKVGSVVVIERTVVKLGNENVVTGKAFDDRVGLATMIEAFREAEDFEPDLYAVATVQEEVGLKGARTSAFSISPDVALALDVTTANDVPGVDEKEYVAILGKGPAIKIMDGRSGSGLIAHPEVKNLLIKAAEEEKIPYQLEVLSGGTTDASIIALNKEGVPSGVISIPTRYIHSPVEVLHLDDVVHSVRLVNAFLKRVNIEWISKIKGVKIK